MGSPPLVRGKGFQGFQRYCRTRITPARAGKSIAGKGIPCCKQDHPRSCGEKKNGKRHQKVLRGSPPLVRGKGKKSSFGALVRRITPARAGKSEVLSSLFPVKRDHPRSCGEKSCFLGLFNHLFGSPPLVRGKEEKDPDFSAFFPLWFLHFL